METDLFGEKPTPPIWHKKLKSFMYYEGVIYEHGLPCDLKPPYEVIEFDGGSSNNCPSQGGYGKGYGSYKIGKSVNYRCEFGNMSANSAEVLTIVHALQSVSDDYRLNKTLLVRGDSQIALRWVDFASRSYPRKISKGSSPEFVAGIHSLFEILPTFKRVLTEWRPRIHSLRIFGH